MNEFYKRVSVPLLFLVCCASTLVAQTTISGTVKDGKSNESLAGVNIIVKGTVNGTISDTNGNFNLKVTQPPPFTISVSYISYKSQDIEVTNTTTTNISISL